MSLSSGVPHVVLLALSLAVSAGCRSDEGNNAADTGGPATIGAATAGGDSARGGMPGMQEMHEDTLAPRVEAHLRRLATTNPDSLKALVPANREMVNALIADCEQMMREMKMQPPAKWTNAVRDLRRDLDRMAGMTGEQLRAAMPQHRQRIEDMLGMRRDMMM
ncbi:MAG: hypothetical protein ABR543_05850 [Gemmatimonadaceae bacterium]